MIFGLAPITQVSSSQREGGQGRQMAFGVGNTPWLEGPKTRFVQYTNPETNIAPDGWNTSFLLDGLFSGANC